MLQIGCGCGSFYLNNMRIRIPSLQGSLLIIGLQAVLKSGTCLEMGHVDCYICNFILVS